MADVRKNEGMVTLASLRGEKRNAILQLSREHGARNIRVFGSVARGMNQPTSDIDFLMEFEEGRNLFDLIRLRLALRDLLETDVEIVTPNSLHYLRARVLAEAQAL